MKPLFDDYLVVDWSANSTPKTGKDSIWWCYLKGTQNSGFEMQLQNPATRHAAMTQIRRLLRTYANSRRRVLVGFDFAYAYPKGFAAYFATKSDIPWRAVWQYLSTVIQDDEKNRNNRFAVAALINQQIAGAAAPFWGCPLSKETAFLSSKKPRGQQATLLPEFRLAEQGNRTHSVWKLFYNGSVGGQSLLGLPRLYQLISDASLKGISKVWPFDTGLRTLSEQDLLGCNILHAEIYPSLLPVRAAPGEVKDCAQVRQLAQYFAELDQRGELRGRFAGSSSLSSEQKTTVEIEEGWVLGIT